MRKREGVEPRNIPTSHLTKVFICWKSELVVSETRSVFQSFSTTQSKRLAYTEVSGSKSVAGRQIDWFGTWESLGIFECYL